VIGWITSGGYGHTVARSLALGYVPRALAGERRGFEIEIIGERRPARILAEPPYDPSGSWMRT
jgi:dimethylglycine dehydrogenase